MTTLDATKSCSTVICRELDRQLIFRINHRAKNTLIDCSELDVKPGDACWLYLQPKAALALQRAIRQRGKTIWVNSCYRTIAQQYLLWRHAKHKRCGITLAATPGRSNHQSGLAIDVQDWEGWKPYLEQEGFKWLGHRDPWHFDYRGSGTKDIRKLSIKAFQTLWNNNYSQKLAVDGIYGVNTARKLGQTHVWGFQKGDRVSVFRILYYRPELFFGEDVQKIQAVLGVTADGWFGKETEAAVKKFQSKAGLVPDGIVGKLTAKALFND